MLNWQQRIGRSEEMTEDTKLILEIIVPIIILLIMFCVMCWNKAITILIIERKRLVIKLIHIIIVTLT